MPGTASGVRTGIKSNKKLRWDRGATKQRYRLEYIQATMSTCGNPSFGSTATRWCTLISGTQMLLLEATDNQPISWLIVILRVLCSSSTKRYPPRPDFVEMGRELTVGSKGMWELQYFLVPTFPTYTHFLCGTTLPPTPLPLKIL